MSNAESALEVRRTVIEQLLDIAYHYLDRCRLPMTVPGLFGQQLAPIFCKAKVDQNACHVSICGSLLLGLQSIGISRPRTSTPFKGSIKGLGVALQSIKIFHFSSFGVHASCDPTAEIRWKVKEILRTIPSSVTAAQEAHLSGRSKLLYPKST
jgi:hypothetical protein